MWSVFSVFLVALSSKAVLPVIVKIITADKRANYNNGNDKNGNNKNTYKNKFNVYNDDILIFRMDDSIAIFRKLIGNRRSTGKIKGCCSKISIVIIILNNSNLIFIFRVI